MLEGLWLWTGRQIYLDLFKYWLKIFALTFGMGVVSGIVMAYQFGTNWSVLLRQRRPVIGPLMAYEVLTAFFLEAGFLGVMLFGMNRVGAGRCTSWPRWRWPSAPSSRPSGSCPPTAGCRRRQATPSVAGGQFRPADWLAVIFNPSFSLPAGSHGLRAPT